MGTIRVVRALTKTGVMAVSHLTVVMVVMAVLHLMVVMEVMAVSHLTVVMEVMAVSHLTVVKEVMAVSHLTVVMVVMADLDHHIKANGAHATTPGKKMIPMVDKANSFLTAHVVTNLTNIVAMMAITGLAVLQAVV